MPVYNFTDPNQEQEDYIAFKPAREIQINDLIVDREGTLYTVTTVEFKNDHVYITAHCDYFIFQPKPIMCPPDMPIRCFTYPAE